MKNAISANIVLLPEAGLETINGELIAVSLPAWLQIKPEVPFKTNSWVRIRYRSSIFQENIRPLIRFSQDGSDSIVQPMNGTLFGVGEWVGYIPKSVKTISVNPVVKTGRFDFSIESIEYISLLGLLLKGAVSSPNMIGWALDSWWKGSLDEARRAIQFSSTSSSVSRYDSWCRRLTRTLDLVGIDRPCCDWANSPRFRIFVSVDGSCSKSLRATVRSMQSQLYRSWSLYCFIEDKYPTEDRWQLQDLFRHPQIAEINASSELSDLVGENDVCVSICAGDLLPDYSLAVVAETLAQRPEAHLIYGDEDSISSSGKLHSPILKPDWSPYFNAGRPYLGQSVFLRGGDLLRCCKKAQDFLSKHDDIIADISRRMLSQSIYHIRRVLYRRAKEVVKVPSHRALKSAHTRRPLEKAAASYPDVMVVVLTRDNANLLSECIDGLTSNTDYPNIHVTLVDNGSVKADSLALLRDMKQNPMFDVLERPGPFNYAQLCNEASRNSSAPILVFLNDDVSMPNPNWLKPLVRLAVCPDVGLVGAKLLFPNGSIQHAGIVIGMGGIAAHVYHGHNASESGYLERLTVVHEVEAVTAACVAIERKKFEVVGGFDAENLAVDLNDVDLCLRLAERGFGPLWTPESVLIHHESASRNRSPRTSETYRLERDYFTKRWRSAIRDDRYFHPNLSLFSYRPALS